MSASISEILHKLSEDHSLKNVRNQGDLLFKENSERECLSLALGIFSSPDYFARMLATYILGRLSPQSSKALASLREKVSRDTDWRVQELLAMAFNEYCAKKGYEKSLPTIMAWLEDKNPNVRRAVVEGLRVWTRKDYFKDNPTLVVKLLEGLNSDPSEYVRKSVGNALQDIR